MLQKLQENLPSIPPSGGDGDSASLCLLVEGDCRAGGLLRLRSSTRLLSSSCSCRARLLSGDCSLLVGVFDLELDMSMLEQEGSVSS